MEKIKYIIYFVIGLVAALFLPPYLVKYYYSSQVSVIKFEQTKHNFDTLYTQTQANTYFVYKNTGKKPLKIDSIQTTCGCTIPTWNSDELFPNQIDSFRVEYSTENKGYFTKEIMVYSNSKTSPDHLEISGFVPFEYQISAKDD
ncbi:MAG: DUF1573 domain-containing protein [Microscillaceae bacterium]|nr:DUF1573 domain-containing protein [Microscillaceae bacterium]